MIAYIASIASPYIASIVRQFWHLKSPYCFVLKCFKPLLIWDYAGKTTYLFSITHSCASDDFTEELSIECKKGENLTTRKKREMMLQFVKGIGNVRKAIFTTSCQITSLC